MFGIILSALNSVIGWIFRSIVIKFGLFFALFFVTTEFTGFVASLVPDSSSVTGLFGNIADEADKKSKEKKKDKAAKSMDMTEIGENIKPIEAKKNDLLLFLN